ncbi:MAG: alanine racemase [Bacteroidia bacterium]|nr:alanine racemase [Bacteroidia bacterium]
MKLGRPWRSEEIAEAVGGQLSPTAHTIEVEYISWDTRRLSGEGKTLFIALKAQRDGHDFLAEAYRKGAAIALVEREPFFPLPYILVPNTWEALHRWAAFWRAQLEYPILALTGSVGKTWVKEWIAYLLEGEMRAYRSPGSFNSRLGVPLSLLSFPKEGDVAIVEAGISAPGEMKPLAELIRPQYGLLTLMGSAHDEAFTSFEEKLEEKLKLFSQVEWLIALRQPQTVSILKKKEKVLYAGFSPEDDIYWERLSPKAGVWHIPDGQAVAFELPSDSKPTWQNALLAAAAAYKLGLRIEAIRTKLATLPGLHSRLQWIQDLSGRLWLNDTYHADEASVAAAIEELRAVSIQPKVAILTDFSPYTEESHREAVEALKAFLPEDSVHLIGETFSRIGWGNTYLSVEEFFRRARLPQRGAILLKGSRRFRLEEALERLMGYGPGPELHIDWEKIYRNLSRLRARLPSSARVMGVVKAEAYGSGDLLMASFLERQGVAYIGVAYAREAIRLREAGIRMPILVFYPGKVPQSLFVEYELEVAVGTEEALEYWAGVVPLHLEVDTGMGRMGLPPHKLSEVLTFLQQRRAEVKGVFSHLAEASQPDHPLTKRQLILFAEAYERVKSVYPDALGHLLNTAGVLSLGEVAAYDMVRIGVGLYGIGEGLEEATSLYAPILRVAKFPAGQRVNYGFFSTVPEGHEVATVAIGYGDGLPRHWAEKEAKVFLQGEACTVLPPLNMDLMLIAVPAGRAHIGEKVEIWGPHRSLASLAQEAGTIPYEILARLSPRVYRMYSWGG